MNDDLISRQAALEIKVSDGYNVDGILYVPFKDVYKHLKTISSVHPEQKTGRWIYMKDCEDWFCSNCKDIFMLLEGTPKDNDYNYCPNCGAKMESEEQ